MKLIRQHLPLFLLPTFLILTAPVAAKGPVDKITIERPGVAEPFEITDADTLNRFDPWGGQFIGPDSPLEWPPDVGLRLPYQVFFYEQNSAGELALRYVFYYYPGVAGNRGYIYLPGTGEPYDRVNTGTIIRGQSDGRWHYAMPTWEAAIRDLLDGQSIPSEGNQKAVTPSVWLAVALGVVVLITGVVWVCLIVTKTRLMVDDSRR